MTSDSGIATAWIAAGAALAATALGALASIISAYISARNARTIQRLHKLQEDSSSQRKQSLEALSRALSAVQHLKDRILLLNQNDKSSISAKSATEMFIEARDRMLEDYENYLANLSKEEDEAFHSAKTLAVEITRQVCSDLENRPDISYLSRTTRDELSKVRELLTEIQHSLRDCLTRRYVQS
jgi:hypothetical protein